MRIVVLQLAALLATAIATQPQVNFPLNLQLPPVARVGEAYSFQFATTTFQPNPEQLVYSIAEGPSWLRIHSENRTLWGTPEAKDAGMATFTIAAAGEAGAVANMESKLPVDKDEGPKVNGNVSLALSKAGQLSRPRSVTLLPSKPFEIVLGQDVFESGGKRLTYHATLADHTPLPAWLSFDANLIRFAGTTPPTASPQTFQILLIASEQSDYTAASVPFTLIVSNHLLLFKPLAQNVNMSKGEKVQIRGLRGMVYLDNAPIRDEDIQSATANIPSWLSFDAHTFDITGTPPSGLMSQNISVTVEDKFGDSAEHSIHLAFTSQLFTGEVGRLDITPGVYFEHQIPKSVLALENERVSVELGDLNKWLSFDSETFTITGEIPDGTTARSVEGSMTATSPDGKTKDTQTFQIEVLGADLNGASDSSGTDANGDGSGKNDGHADTATESSSSSPRKKAGIIVGAVISSLVAAAIIVILVISLCQRRKKRGKGYLSPRKPRSPRKTDISRPIPAVIDWREMEKAEDDDLEKGKLDDSPGRTADLPPQLEVSLPTKEKVRNSWATSLDEKNDNIYTSFNISYGSPGEAGPSHHPHDSMKIPTESLRRKSAGSPSHKRRRTTRVSGSSTHRSSGLPVNRHLTGLGHGRHTYSPSRSTNVSAAQRTQSTSSYTTVVSTVPSAFPQPSKARHTTQLTIPNEKHPQSVRLVAPSTCNSSVERVERLIDPRTIDEKRHSYIRKRASAQSPFFNPSRGSSSSYKCPPSFIADASPTAKTPLSPPSPNLAKSNDALSSPVSDIPESLRIRRPADTPSPATSFDLSRSLRKNRPTRTFLHRHTDAQSSPPHLRPETAVYAPTASSQASLLSTELKKSINRETGAEIWNDAELSESHYSGEEDDIEEAEERRATLRPSASLREKVVPLKVEKKHDDQRDSKRSSKRDSKGGLKRASERDPTPYPPLGKENLPSSRYSLTDASKHTSPSRPKTAVGHRPGGHSRNFSRTMTRSPSHRTSTSGHPLPRIPSTKERHSRKSIHSRSQSRQSTPRKLRDRSRTQSGAFPRHADAQALCYEINKAAERSSVVTTHAHKSTAESAGEGEEAKREKARAYRRSRLAQSDTSPFYHAKRDTAIPPPSTPKRPSIGLGLSLYKGRLAGEDDTPGPESAGRQRTPLSVLDDGNGGSPERVRVREGKEKRPISVEVGEEGQKNKFGGLRGMWERTGSFWGGEETKAFM